MRIFRILILVVIVGLGFGLWHIAVPPLPENVTRRVAEIDGREVTFLLLAFPTDAWEWSLAADITDAKTPEEWHTVLGADVVVNGTYFGTDNMPSGYYQLEGASAVPWPSEEEQKEPSSYSFLTSIVDGAPRFAYLPNAPQPEPTTPSLLSFPTLIAQSSTLVDEDTFRYAERTVLAAAEDGTPYIVLTEDGEVSLYELATWLSAQPERFTLAGNLDGGPSTGLFYEQGIFDLSVPSTAIPNVIALRRKE